MDTTNNAFATTISERHGSPVRFMANKVPEVTLIFWIIKILCTTVGETAADYLNTTLGFGLTGTSIVMGILLIVALGVQFRTRSYVPLVYWVTVVLISIVGTLITDNLTDHFGVPLRLTTGIFAVALIGVFAWWASVEKTLSVHTIVTSRREGFYWLAILVTFALGTAAGDYVAEAMSIGYLRSALVFGGAIAVVYAAHKLLGLNAILAFWAAYVLTRPFGASLGDLLSQPREEGGYGLGTTGTSFLFLAAIVILIIVVSLTQLDVTEPTGTEEASA